MNPVRIRDVKIGLVNSSARFDTMFQIESVTLNDFGGGHALTVLLDSPVWLFPAAVLTSFCRRVFHHLFQSRRCPRDTTVAVTTTIKIEMNRSEIGRASCRVTVKI